MLRRVRKRCLNYTWLRGIDWYHIDGCTTSCVQLQSESNWQHLLRLIINRATAADRNTPAIWLQAIGFHLFNITHLS